MVESQPPNNRAPGLSPFRGTFVGRQREMGELKAALEDAMAGRGCLVTLAGEPGIGKTRMAQELADVAASKGAQVLWGWCYEEGGAPPYWPWVQPLRDYIQQKNPNQLLSEMGAGASDIAEIIPELRKKLPDLEPPPALEPEQARFRLFDSIATFLKNATRPQPLVLVLDDLHWADQSSLLLLEFIFRGIDVCRLLVLGTYRDVEVSRRHPLSQTLGGLIREPRFLRLPLAGLSRPEVGQLIQSATGTEPLPPLVETIHARTEGNPLFLGEVVRMLTQEGPESWQERVTQIPEGVRAALGRHFNHLSEACNQVMTTASVIGRQFEFRLLRPLNDDLSDEQLLPLVDEALAAHVIEPVRQPAEAYRFSHALVQETLLSELSASRRARMHARIAEALEEIYGVNAETHASELAHHFAEAQAVVGTEKLVHYSLLAGEQALASYAYEEALNHFERGLVARDISLAGTEDAFDEEAADLLFGLARAQSATGVGRQLVEAFATLSRAFEYYAEAGNIALAVAAAEFPIALPANRIPGVAQLMARALTLVPADSHEAGRLFSRYGGILGVAEFDYEGAQQALVRAMDIARREGDVPLEVQTLTYAADVSARHLHWQESVDNGLRAIELATGDENPWSELGPRWWAAVGLLYMGDLDGARPHALVLRDLAERRSTRLLAIDSFLPITYLSCLEGDWKAGREYSDQGLEVSPLNPQLLGTRVLLEHQTGESAQGEVYLERLLDVMRRAGPDQFFASSRASIAIAAIARITGVPDRLAIAEAALLSKQSPTPLAAMFGQAGLALLAVQKGDQSAAEEHYAYLQGQRGTMIWTVSSGDRLLGLLAQTMGKLDQAAAHFEDALVFCHKAGYQPELAWTCHDYADTLLQRKGPGDRVKADALLDESLAISTDLGMRPLMERVAALQDRAASQPEAAPAYPDGLTSREVEVLRLVALGKSNREIVDELFIAEGTVRRHINNIYEKIGVANRAEATRYVLTQGLL